MSCPYEYEENDNCDEAMSVTWEEKRIVARKPHWCCECGAKIGAKERCEVAKWLAEGEGWRTVYRCVDCAAVAQMIADRQKLCPLWGGLQYSATEVGFDWDSYATERKIQWAN